MASLQLYEFALGKTFSQPRGILISSNKVKQKIIEQGDNPCGISVFTYDAEDRTHMEGESPSVWFNQRYCPWVPIDIDKGDNDDKLVLHQLASLIFNLEELGLNQHMYKAYFSGRGYHLMIHGDCFGFPKDHQDLPYVVKATMKKLGEAIGMYEIMDDKVYMRTSIIRCPHSFNPKSGLYKIPLTRNEVMAENPNAILELAKTPRLDFPWLSNYYGDGELSSYVVTDIPPVPAYLDVPEPINNYTCIHRMLEQGPVEGSRNNTLLVLASHLMQAGIPSALAKDWLLNWNDRSLDERIVVEKVEYVYGRKYKYTCKNRLKKKHCSTRCVYYGNKVAFSGTNPTFEEILEIAKNRDFLKEFQEGVNLGRLFGTTDFVVLRGDIVTILGMTKANKSTLAKNITLGYNPVSDSFCDISQLRRTLYYTSEQASEYFLLTCCRILEGCNDLTSLKKKDYLLEKWAHRVKHIMPIDQSPTVPGLKEHLNEYQPEVVVIDTIDHMADNQNSEHLGIKALMLELQEISHTTGVVFYVVSQIKRQDALEGAVTLFSGKGSGSIENQSRKVIGIAAPDKSGRRILSFLANSTGSIPEENIELQVNDSLRLKLK